MIVTAVFLVKKTIRLATEAITKLLEFLARKTSRRKKSSLMALKFYENVVKGSITLHAKIHGGSVCRQSFTGKTNICRLHWDLHTIHSKISNTVMTLG